MNLNKEIIKSISLLLASAILLTACQGQKKFSTSEQSLSNSINSTENNKNSIDSDKINSSDDSEKEDWINFKHSEFLNLYYIDETSNKLLIASDNKPVYKENPLELVLFYSVQPYAKLDWNIIDVKITVKSGSADIPISIKKDGEKATSQIVKITSYQENEIHVFADFNLDTDKNILPFTVTVTPQPSFIPPSESLIFRGASTISSFIKMEKTNKSIKYPEVYVPEKDEYIEISGSSYNSHIIEFKHKFTSEDISANEIPLYKNFTKKQDDFIYFTFKANPEDTVPIIGEILVDGEPVPAFNNKTKVLIDTTNGKSFFQMQIPVSSLGGKGKHYLQFLGIKQQENMTNEKEFGPEAYVSPREILTIE